MNASQEAKSTAFHNILISWAKVNTRSFAWRRSDNPFHILIAELLLRKTQAERVATIFDDFCRKYSTPDRVLKATYDELEQSIGSLGLKQRIGWLKSICKQLVYVYNSRVPNEYEKLCELMGVGSYTANMVLCLGYRKQCAPIDNNVARLVSRVFGVKRFKDTRREREVEAVLASVIKEGSAKDITLAMLDLSALKCKALKPGCIDCPLIGICDFGNRSN